MNKKHTLLLIVLISAATGPMATAQFSSGSNGSYGPMNITNDTTLPLPPDGIFHCTTINVASGATLKFTKNALNTPVYLLATGDVVVSGVIDISGGSGRQALAGEGGPGGFDGGLPASGDLPPGDGGGPGAGQGAFPNRGSWTEAGGGSYGAQPRLGGGGQHGATYGNSLILPLIGGSGGGGRGGNPGEGGGGGGGALLLSSSSSVLIHGELWAKGGTIDLPFGAPLHGSGSGGGIRIVAPTVAGSGRISADSQGGTAGGSGRVRIDCVDRSQWAFRFTGRVTYGQEMYVFPPVASSLSIVEAAGQTIAEGTTTSVKIQLTTGTSTNQTIRLRARGFTGVVPLEVVVTPENGSRRVFPAQVDMSTGNPAEVTVPIQIYPDTVNIIHAWSR